MLPSHPSLSARGWLGLEAHLQHSLHGCSRMAVYPTSCGNALACNKHRMSAVQLELTKLDLNTPFLHNYNL